MGDMELKGKITLQTIPSPIDGFSISGPNEVLCAFRDGWFMLGGDAETWRARVNLDTADVEFAPGVEPMDAGRLFWEAVYAIEYPYRALK